MIHNDRVAGARSEHIAHLVSHGIEACAGIFGRCTCAARIFGQLKIVGGELVCDHCQQFTVRLLRKPLSPQIIKVGHTGLCIAYEVLSVERHGQRQYLAGYVYYHSDCLGVVLHHQASAPEGVYSLSIPMHKSRERIKRAIWRRVSITASGVSANR